MLTHLVKIHFMSTEELLNEIKSERKTAQFDGQAVKKGCKDVFSQMVEDQSPLILYRNMLLWRLQDRDGVLEKYDVIPELRQFPTDVYPNAKFSRSAPDVLATVLIGGHLEQTCMMLPLYFEDKPLLRDYFCNVGCANWFGRYQDADEQQRAAKFLCQLTERGLTPLMVHLTCNFTLHAHQFVKNIRDEYLMGLAERGNDCNHIELLRTACVNSVPRMGVSCLSVWTAILEKDRTNNEVSSGFVDKFLVPCVLLWTLLPSVEGVDLPTMLWGMKNKQEFFEPIATEMLNRKGGGSLEPALGPVVQIAPRELWSSLDCYLVYDLQRYIAETANVDIPHSVPEAPKDLLGEAFVVFFLLLKKLAGTPIDKEKVPGETATLNEELKRWIEDCNMRGEDHIFSLPGLVQGKLTEFDKFAINKEVATMRYNKSVKEIMRGKLSAYTIMKSQLDEVHWQVVAASYVYAKRSIGKGGNKKEFLKCLKGLNVEPTAKMLISVMMRCFSVASKMEDKKTFGPNLAKFGVREPAKRTGDCRKVLERRLTAVDQVDVIRETYLSVMSKCMGGSEIRIVPDDIPIFSRVLLRWLNIHSCGQILAFLDTMPLERIATQDVKHADRSDEETITILMEPLGQPCTFVQYLITTIINSTRTGERILLMLQLAKMVRSLFKCFDSAPEKDVHGECSLAFELLFPPPEADKSDMKKDFARALRQAQASLADDKLIFRHDFLPEEIWGALADLSHWCG